MHDFAIFPSCYFILKPFWHHFLLHPCHSTSSQLSSHCTSNQIVIFLFFSNTTSESKTLNFLTIFFKLTFQHMLNSLVSVFLDSFFTLKVQQVNFFRCSNFIFILPRVTFHLKLHVSLEWLAF